ncbi:MAG: Gfo/Idh/MocA family oxidoreductase [Planctomycetaceae bacterium]|nr:Gfo/Idh/MocA family oxidoreductase [Planctomycetaceae bacterium]
MKTTRRNFLQTTALSGVAAFAAPAFLSAKDVNGKLNVACIGVQGMGHASVQGVSGENIIGLADVAADRLAKTAAEQPKAETFADFRDMITKFDGKLDAVTVGTPDHIHAAASVFAMKRGIHCYTEKPLSHDVHEAAVMIDLAKKKNLKTQMGTQIHASDNYRRVVELIQGGAIGKIKEVHCWVGKAWGNRPIPKFDGQVPESLNWELWQGPVPERPYNPCYVPGNWRSYWMYGTGTLGDMACHIVDLPFWALSLRHPKTIEANYPAVVCPETCPIGLQVKYEFPKEEGHDALTLTWYDHNLRPPQLAEYNMPNLGLGILFVGADGLLLADYGRYILYPEDKFKDFKAPKPSIPKSIGHHAEWLKAIKDGGDAQPLCNFGYSGVLTQAVLLGGVAYRAGKKITWNPETQTTGDAAADKFLADERRKGWEL